MEHGTSSESELAPLLSALKLLLSRLNPHLHRSDRTRRDSPTLRAIQPRDLAGRYLGDSASNTNATANHAGGGGAAAAAAGRPAAIGSLNRMDPAVRAVCFSQRSWYWATWC
eukprot:314883-Rhodomonas_salina.1